MAVRDLQVILSSLPLQTRDVNTNHTCFFGAELAYAQYSVAF